MRFNIIDLTDGWLVDWSQSGGHFKEWVRNMQLTAINHGWFYALRMEPVHVYNNICHALSWMPLLYKDRDWDHIYLWILMREKLRRMRRHHEEDQITADYAKIANEIFIAETLLTRLIEDKYADNDWEEHRKKYGSAFWRTEDGPNGTRIMRPPQGSGYSDGVRRIAEHEWKMQRADAEFLGSWLARHSRNWWS